MSYVEDLRGNYAAVRARLYNPARAIPDAERFRFAQDCRAPADEADSMLKGGSKEALRRAKRAHRNLLGVNWIDIANEVAKKYDIPLAALKSKNRGRGEITNARNELYYLMRKSGMSNAQVGRVLKRDPSTVAAGAMRWARENGL